MNKNKYTFDEKEMDEICKYIQNRRFKEVDERELTQIIKYINKKEGRNWIDMDKKKLTAIKDWINYSGVDYVYNMKCPEGHIFSIKDRDIPNNMECPYCKTN